MPERRNVNRMTRNQSLELALADDNDKTFGLCSDHRDDKLCEDRNYGRIEHGKESREGGNEKCNQQEGNDHFSEHVDDSKHKFTPTLRRSNKFRKPLVYFHETTMVAIEKNFNLRGSHH